jgi:Transposase
MLYTNKKMQYVYVGVDSHKNTHTAFFMNCFYEKLGEITFSTVPSEFEAFYKKAKKHLLPGTTFAWGLEDVSLFGRTLTKFLISKQQLVKHVNSTLVASERKMQNVPHKTDSVDAECAARILLSRFDKLPHAMPDDKFFILKTG